MNILTPDIKHIDEITFAKDMLKAFDEESVEFIATLSKNLLQSKAYRLFPELVALGFWMRHSHIKQLKKDFFLRNSERILLPRGIVFHIAPTNVDTIFVYSMILSMLAGNSNILRVSQKSNPQIDALLNLIVTTIKEYPRLYERTFIIRYAHEDDINKKLSSYCDVRVIWGGDETIKHIRSIPIKATSTELVFADKFSLLVIDAKKTLFDEYFYEALYRDSFTFMQEACSSIRSVCWLNADEDIKSEFWNGFSRYIKEQNISLEPKNIMDKLVAQSSLAIENPQIKTQFKDEISIVSLNDISQIDVAKHCGFGLFYEVDIEDIETLFSHSFRKYQTLVVSAIEKKSIIKAIQNTQPKGIDRIVKLGEAMNFKSLWDGYDIIFSLSRIVDVDI